MCLVRPILGHFDGRWESTEQDALILDLYYRQQNTYMCQTLIRFSLFDCQLGLYTSLEKFFSMSSFSWAVV
jgi:hypothetical protein